MSIKAETVGTVKKRERYTLLIKSVAMIGYNLSNSNIVSI